MTVLTLALLAGSQPAAPRLAPVHQIGPQSRRQSPHTPCAPLVRTDALTVTWQKADRYKRSAPTSSSHTPWPNPHSACGTAAAPLPAISCLGAFRPPAARARGEVRHCRQPKTCTDDSNLHKRGHRSGPATGTAIRGTEFMECRRRRATRSLRLDVGRPDHLAPLLGFVGDELTEFGRRARKRRATEVGKARLILGSASAALISLLSMPTISAGVFLGAPTPYTCSPRTPARTQPRSGCHSASLSASQRSLPAGAACRL